MYTLPRICIKTRLEVSCEGIKAKSIWVNQSSFNTKLKAFVVVYQSCIHIYENENRQKPAANHFCFIIFNQNNSVFVMFVYDIIFLDTFINLRFSPLFLLITYTCCFDNLVCVLRLHSLWSCSLHIP